MSEPLHLPSESTAMMPDRVELRKVQRVFEEVASEGAIANKDALVKLTLAATALDFQCSPADVWQLMLKQNLLSKEPLDFASFQRFMEGLAKTDVNAEEASAEECDPNVCPICYSDLKNHEEKYCQQCAMSELQETGKAHIQERSFDSGFLIFVIADVSVFAVAQTSELEKQLTQ